MNKKIILFIVAVVFSLACDAELLKSTQEPQILAVDSNKGFFVDPGDTIIFTVDATDPDDGDLSYTWEVESGLILEGRNSKELIWEAPFRAGTYSIRIIVSNGEKNTDRKVDVVVKSLFAPSVRIVDPDEGSTLVQNDNSIIRVQARHEDGISRAWVVVNDTLQLLISPDISGDEYVFIWDTQIGYGQVEIKVIAEAQFSKALGSDSVNVNIAGFVLGKPEEYESK